MKRKTRAKPNPPHVKLFRTSCRECGRTYEGNFPMWVRIGPFPCICGAIVPAPLVLAGPLDDRYGPPA